MKLVLAIASNVIHMVLQIWSDLKNSSIQKIFKRHKIDLSQMRQLSNIYSDNIEIMLHAITSKLESDIVETDLSISQWEGRIQDKWYIKPWSLHWWNH